MRSHTSEAEMEVVLEVRVAHPEKAGVEEQCALSRKTIRDRP